MDVLLTVLSCLLALAFVVALTWFLIRILDHLESIGTGGSSSLAMVAWGVRAIEVETGHVPSEVTQLNGSLSQVSDGLRRIDEGLVAIAEAASEQERYQP